jgi:uncharacterized membrane protein YsdA (DUF1294 family)
MDVSVITITVVLVVIGLIALSAVAADRAARAEAWRRIAEERRWNWEHRSTDSDR